MVGWFKNNKKHFASFLAKSFLFICMLLFVPMIFTGCDSSYTRPYDDGYRILNYVVNMNVSEDNTVEVREVLTIKYTKSSLGFDRYLPMYQLAETEDENGRQYTSYRNSYSNVRLASSTNDSMIVEQFEESGFLVVGIEKSSGGRFTGEVSYALTYSIDLGDDRDTSKDSFYFNVIGDGWDTYIDRAEFTVKFPKPLQNEVWCYPGNGEAFTIETTNEGKTVTGVITGLKYGEGVTVRTVMSEGYFNNRKTYVWDIVILTAVIAVAAIATVYISKRKKSTIIEVVEFEAPDGVSPTEAGFVAKGKVDDKDIVALIVHFAQKGYLKIEEDDKQKIKLIKLKEVGTANVGKDVLTNHEKIVFNALFKSRNEIYINMLGLDFANAAKSAAMHVTAVGSKKYLLEKQKNTRNLFPFLSTVLMILAAIKVSYESVSLLTAVFGFLGAALMMIASFIYINSSDFEKTRTKEKNTVLKVISLLLMVIGAVLVQMGINPAGNIYFFDLYCDPFFLRLVITLLSAFLMFYVVKVETYTENGRNLLGRLMGLKNFIEVAEKDRLEMLVKDDPEAFFKILPYAYVLGVSDVWIKKFETINLKTPDWYVSSRPNIGMYICMNMMFRTMSVTARSISAERARAVAAAARSSGGSFGGGRSGGGGFSGGGRGGGGGGRR